LDKRETNKKSNSSHKEKHLLVDVGGTKEPGKTIIKKISNSISKKLKQSQTKKAFEKSIFYGNSGNIVK
jgi:hypothetical protein